MNEIFKRFIEIADKLKELLNFKGKIDLIYIMEVKGRIILAFPVVRGLIREDLMLKLEEIYL